MTNQHSKTDSKQPAGLAAKAAGTVAEAGGSAADKADKSARASGRVFTGALGGVESGRKAVTATAGRAGAAALTAWAAFKNRKLIAALSAAGITALGLATYGAGRRAERNRRGPVARWSGGRL
ncbi:hypothetical protein G6045_04445 [Streptomyces sp. YC504]|uniref:Uncharacterized protein n=1 Tax=Streptomyces mesophilus TaxID=1775132 RepID=A0A6G4XBM1_9ACTN|nr:hypothetical protein [Streptomyces mesophilus]NGO74939.1 hypothetical protein [Streptomyces mesophilus]